MLTPVAKCLPAHHGRSGPERGPTAAVAGPKTFAHCVASHLNRRGVCLWGTPSNGTGTNTKWQRKKSFNLSSVKNLLQTFRLKSFSSILNSEKNCLLMSAYHTIPAAFWLSWTLKSFINISIIKQQCTNWLATYTILIYLWTCKCTETFCKHFEGTQGDNFCIHEYRLTQSNGTCWIWLQCNTHPG